MGTADGFTDSAELDGLTVYDSEGERIGSVGRVYVDDSTGRPDWITVKTGLFGMKESFVPLAGARRAGPDLHIPYPKDRVKEAPGWTRTRICPWWRRKSSTATTTCRRQDRRARWPGRRAARPVRSRASRTASSSDGPGAITSLGAAHGRCGR